MGELHRFPIRGDNQSQRRLNLMIISLVFAGVSAGGGVVSQIITAEFMRGAEHARIDSMEEKVSSLVTIMSDSQREMRDGFRSTNDMINHINIQQAAMQSQIDALSHSLQQERQDRLDAESRFWNRK